MVSRLRRALIAAAVATAWGTPARAQDPQPDPPPDPEDEGEDAAVYDDPLDVFVAGAKARETSGSAHVVRPKQLERFEHSDPHQVLLAVPGVYVRGEDGFGLRPNIGMRGALSDRSKKVTLMEDGVLFGPAPYSAPAAYYFPMITRMYSVRVIKGPSAIIYGPHTVAGAVDLVTAPIPDGDHAYADLAAGMFLSRKAHVRLSTSGDHLGILVEGVHEANDGFKRLDGGGGDTGYARYEVMTKARASFGTETSLLHELQLKLGLSTEQSNETYLGLTTEDFEQDPYRRYAPSQDDRMSYWRTQVALTHTAQRGDDLEITSTFYRHDLHRVWRKVNGFRGASLYDVLANPDDPRNALFYGVLTGQVPPSTDAETLLIGPNDRRYVSQGFQTKLNWQPNSGPVSHKIEVGARIHHDAIERLHSQDGFLIDGYDLVPDGEETEITSDNEARTLALALWAVHSGTWGPVTVTAGGRIESIQSRFDDALTDRQEGILQQVILPGGGVFVALPYEFGLLGGVYQGFSPIPPGQSANVTPEKSLNFEWGARWSPEPLVRVEVIGFFNDYANLSNVCTFSSGCTGDDIDRQFDAGEATIAGLEAYADAEIRLPHDLTLPARVAYTFTKATFDTTFDSADPIFGEVEEGDEVPYVPEHQLSAAVGLEHAWAGGDVSGTFVSAMRETAGTGEPLPFETTDAHFLLDATAYVRPFSFWKIYAVGRNLLDMDYVASHRPYGARPGAPLWVQIGTKLTH
jgi:Fe(3+) dicitrate transport protein